MSDQKNDTLPKNKTDTEYIQLHMHSALRKHCEWDKALFSPTGNLVLENISDLYIFIENYHTALEKGLFGSVKKEEYFIKAGELNAKGIINSIYHYLCRLYLKEVRKDFFSKGLAFIQNEFILQDKDADAVETLLIQFCTEFPPRAVIKENIPITEWLKDVDPDSGIKNKELAFEELLLLKLANENSALTSYELFFNDKNLAKNKNYPLFWELTKEWSKKNKSFGSEGLDLISMFKAPVHYSPYSIKGQLKYIKKRWAPLLNAWLRKILEGIDIISEEEKDSWIAPGAPGGEHKTNVYHFENLTNECEHFTADQDWMPNTIMIAKSTLVWLDQLSRKYQCSITRLDQIPNEEIDFLSRVGFTGLWLIGVWERSKGSARIKQICGNPEAAASAYSLNDYQIAASLGGWEALADLRHRASERGIKLAADMVPNHTGLDSKWVIEDPDVFIQTREPPYPSYDFQGENLSQDDRVGIYLENHYYSKTDCAVVFKRTDNYTGDVRYIYHGNDGTGLPWNDTAQIDFLNSYAREKVIKEIINVAQNFPIVRFDAAMVLAKKNIRRLWYPEPGQGGDIASRSRFALSLKEFMEKIPTEFWREVVDRCAIEAPDTLLIAEAFWMMEGYFVRTLGMHRVYNSAFMNMLKKEENDHYRTTIKNTLEFDPRILKRYVNFMNNPDEETAVKQFGKDDKYFGVCTMMVTMPGLPMFGHGQIEGFEEKYGMEYQKAYYNEEVDQTLLERHRREIFPLMRMRPLFSGVENFLFYDFWSNGQVNENIFVWSNRLGNEGALIFFNNVYQEASGWIKTSVAYAVKNEEGESTLIQKSIAQGLGLSNREESFTLFYEQRSQLWYIRTNKEIIEKGIFASLQGFQSQVFLHIHEVKDNSEQHYRNLYESLNGMGVNNIPMAINNILYKNLYTKLTAFANSHYFKTLLEFFNSENRGKKKHDAEIKEFITEIKPFAEAFFDECITVKNTLLKKKETVLKKIDKTILWESFKKSLQTLIHIAFDELGKEADTKKITALTSLRKSLSNQINLSLTNSAGIILATVAELHEQEKIDLITTAALDIKILELLEAYAFTEPNINEDIPLLKMLYPLKEITIKALSKIKSLDIQKNKEAIVNPILTSLFAKKEILQFLNVHEWNDILWFNKERSEKLLILGLFYALTQTDISSKKNVAEIAHICEYFKALLIQSKYQVNLLYPKQGSPDKEKL